MLSFQKSHKIEGMIIFQLSASDEILGLTKEEFISKIEHKLNLFQISPDNNTTRDMNISIGESQTQFANVRDSCETLN